MTSFNGGLSTKSSTSSIKVVWKLWADSVEFPISPCGEYALSCKVDIVFLKSGKPSSSPSAGGWSGATRALSIAHDNREIKIVSVMHPAARGAVFYSGEPIGFPYPNT